MKIRLQAALLLCLPALAEPFWKKNKVEQPSEIDRYIESANKNAALTSGHAASPGSLFASGTRMSDLVRDPRAYLVDDMVTVVVSDSASAVSKGVTNTSRKSNSKSAITALAGPLPATGRLANLASMGGETTLDAQGQTSRSTQLNTTLAARVTHVLPNGYLVIEGLKEIAVNSERQTVLVRGVCRPADLTQGNTISSDKLAQLEVRINGKGVVADAVKRPFILYRILQGILPF